MDPPYGAMRLEGFLRAVASKQPAPGGGAVAAMAVAGGAGLVAMSARFSENALGDAATVIQQAERLQARALRLADEDAESYGEVIETCRTPRDGDGERRRAAIRAALRRAAEVPLRIAEAAAGVGTLAIRMLEEGNRNLAGDAYTAVLLAHAAAHSTELLVRVNIDAGQLDRELVEQVAHHRGEVESAMRKAQRWVGERISDDVEPSGGPAPR